MAEGRPARRGGARNAPPDFKGQKHKDDSHASTSDPDSRLYRKGNTGARLSCQGHVLMEHRNGLVRGACASQATGHAGYALSLKTRAWIETHFGWLKAASNLARLPKQLAAGAEA